MKTILIDGQEYKLVPVNRESVFDLLSDKSEDIELFTDGRAVPKVSQYREKFKSRSLTPTDLPRKQWVYQKLDNMSDPYVARDPNFTGAGLEYDI